MKRALYPGQTLYCNLKHVLYLGQTLYHKYHYNVYVFTECPGLTDAQAVDTTTVDQFRGCNIITGNLRIGSAFEFKCVRKVDHIILFVEGD